MEDTCRRLAKVALVLDHADRASCAKACEILKAEMLRGAKEVIAQAKGRPIVLSYSSDGTPIQTQRRVRRQLRGKQRATERMGYETEEYLVQQAFVRFIDMQGIPHTAAVLRDPLPLTHGKSAWAAFAAARDFLPTLTELGHYGVQIQHLVFDRALERPLSRHFQQQVKLQQSMAVRTMGQDPMRLLQPLLTWVVHTGCCNHDCHNGLKWGLWRSWNDGTVLKDVYVAIESLRRSYNILYERMAPWLQRVVYFTDEAEDVATLSQLWAALGVDPEFIEDIAGLGLLWRGGRLLVRRAHQHNAELFDTLSTCLLELWKFTRFSESRWCTVGASCRVLASALLTGVDDLVAEILLSRTS